MNPAFIQYIQAQKKREARKALQYTHAVRQDALEGRKIACILVGEVVEKAMKNWWSDGSPVNNKWVCGSWTEFCGPQAP